MGLGLGLILALAAGAGHGAPANPAKPASTVAPHVDRPAVPDRPATPLERLQYAGRAQPDATVPALARYVDTLAPDDPHQLDALMELGVEDIRLSRGDDVEQVVHRIEALKGNASFLRGATLLLRGQWLATHGEIGKAESQFIEAAALLTADAPGVLRLDLATFRAEVEVRRGRYDQALMLYNQGLKLVDNDGLAWQRSDLRYAIAKVFIEAGQYDKAMELTQLELRLSADAGDEYGMSRAMTVRYFQLAHNGGDSEGALTAARSALEHATLSGDKHQILLATANIADCYLRRNDFKMAYDLSQSTLAIARKANDEEVQSALLANAGLALIGMRRRDEGLPLVRESMGLAERSDSVRDVANLAGELGRYLERAGYLGDALAAYHQYRQMSDELNQQDRQRALIELQESFANESRQHEMDMLSREGRLKDEEIRHHDLQIKQWTAAGLSSLLLLAVIAALARRLRVRNRQLSVSNEALRLQAETDPLTGLSNRHHLQTVMAQGAGRPLEGTLYLLDIDHFKHINDRCGHAGGDAVLVEIARRLRGTLRDEDLIVRWGGEEFLVLVKPLPRAEGEALAQRLLCALADTPVLHEGKPVTVSASIGFGQFPMPGAMPHPELDLPLSGAISLVDAAMFIAKARGRNSACGIRRIDVDTPRELDDVTQALEAAEAEGRVELCLHPGPRLRGAAA